MQRWDQGPALGSTAASTGRDKAKGQGQACHNAAERVPWRRLHIASWVALYLRQCRCGLGQPEGHVHGPVQCHGRPKGAASLLPLSSGGIQQAETTLAMGLEWA